MSPPPLLTAADVVRLLDLGPLEPEGGWFRETWRSTLDLPDQALPDHAGPRAAGTAIYYLLAPGVVSAMHRVVGDEVYHFYLGDPVQMLQLRPDGSGEVIVLGTDLADGQRPQVMVPGGTWQGSRLADGGRFALLGATMAPGFDYRDFALGTRAELARDHPEHAAMIAYLTGPDEPRTT